MRRHLLSFSEIAMFGRAAHKAISQLPLPVAFCFWLVAVSAILHGTLLGNYDAALGFALAWLAFGAAFTFADMAAESLKQSKQLLELVNQYMRMIDDHMRDEPEARP